MLDDGFFGEVAYCNDFVSVLHCDFFFVKYGAI